MKTNNFLIVDKPKYWTSFDVVNFIKKKYNFKKVGHAGTLDPLATGVLVIACNDQTKKLNDLTLEDKEYELEIMFGIKTDSFDLSGNFLEIRKTNIKIDQIKEAINFFNKKEYFQQVPIYSATKINGKKLYEYARSNKDVLLPSKLVNIKDINFIDFNEQKQILKLRMLVSKGFYVRSFSQEIAKYLNTIATLSNLVRTKSGQFELKQAIKIKF